MLTDQLKVRMNPSVGVMNGNIAGSLGSIPGPVESNAVSPMARCRCDVSSEMCCPGANPRRWNRPLEDLKL